jgi:hypothetical protein
MYVPFCIMFTRHSTSNPIQLKNKYQYLDPLWEPSDEFFIWLFMTVYNLLSSVTLNYDTVEWS